jgi:hypothetical protein
MPAKPYSPVASYAQLKQVETEIDKAQTIDDIRKILVKDGMKIGYKAFCYMLMNKMTPETMKPDEAAIAAVKLEQEGDKEAALRIFQRILADHPDHPLAKQKIAETKDDLPNWIAKS